MKKDMINDKGLIKGKGQRLCKEDYTELYAVIKKIYSNTHETANRQTIMPDYRGVWVKAPK